jgi:hypothetical protein
MSTVPETGRPLTRRWRVTDAGPFSAPASAPEVTRYTGSGPDDTLFHRARRPAPSSNPAPAAP